MTPPTTTGLATQRGPASEDNAAATRITLSADELAPPQPITGQVAGDRYSDMSPTSAGARGLNTGCRRLQRQRVVSTAVPVAAAGSVETVTPM
ncbi:hypothetical protein [Actinacidiphila paucisporea]|uniref:Uncharacterized protein n=1 Tax=Actinacidiphila paucisporea TaxID=310782 RepID=A0A1M6YMP0_9ACTN|nr:hypothetical protein SAMN05216499_10351 [Actinacidiphila paucisporea]